MATAIVLGCGNKHLRGRDGNKCINIDINPKVNPDLVCDLENPLPLSDDTIDVVMAYHTLEHINNFIQLMKEIHRVCTEGARVYIKVPPITYQSNVFEGAFKDPTHVRFFTEHTFDYFDKRTPEGNLYDFPFFAVIKSEVTKEGIDPELEVELMVVKNYKIKEDK